MAGVADVVAFVRRRRRRIWIEGKGVVEDEEVEGDDVGNVDLLVFGALFPFGM